MSFKEWAACLIGAAILVFVGTISCQKLSEAFWENAIKQLDVGIP